MSERYLFFSDLHIHSHHNDWKRVDDGCQVLDWILEEANLLNIEKIFFLGDWFHVRGYLYPTIVSKSYDKLLKFKKAGKKMYLLVGNHDMPSRHTTKHNALTAFGSLFDIVEQPMVYDEDPNYNFYFIPYVENADRLNWAIDKIHNISVKESVGKKRVLLGHLDMNNALYHSNAFSTAGVDSKNLSDRFDMVITGHYHINQVINGNIYYIGSPYQQNFGEANQRKGYYIFDNGKMTFRENTFSPQYKYINANQINESITNNYIKINAKKDSNVAALKEEAMVYGPRSVSVRFGEETAASIGGLVEIKQDTKDISLLLQDWVNKNANSKIYDKDRLYKFGMDIVTNSSKSISVEL